MYTDYLRNIVVGDTEGVKWCIVQAWLHQAVINAKITIPVSDPLLRDIVVGDTEGIKWAILQRWTTLLADNEVSTPGVAGDTVQEFSLSAGATSQAFTLPYASSVTSCLAQLIGPSGAGLIACLPTNLTTAGGTVVFAVPIPASGWKLAVRSTGS